MPPFCRSRCVQPGGQIIQLGQLYLQFAFVAFRALGKNIQNQAVAVYHPTLKLALQIALLRRRQLVIENHHIGLQAAHFAGDFFHFALAGKQGGVRAAALGLNH